MAATRHLPTRFAPAERAPPEVLRRQAHLAWDLAVLEEALATVPDAVMVLNQDRQVVFANRAAQDLTGRQEDVVGMRPGELMGCVHAFESQGGCGTTESCGLCGVVRSVVRATAHGDAQRDARITLLSGASMDLRARARCITVDGETLTVLSLRDIADENRRRVLERVFFHDVLNTAEGVRRLTGMLHDASGEERGGVVGSLRDATEQLVSEIRAQRVLASAETGDYHVSLERESVARVLAEALGAQAFLARARGVRVEMDADVPDALLETDLTLLRRVLGNLITNAVEASRAGMTVGVGAEVDGGRVRFRVRNPTPMPRAAELQVFQRSFSSKGPDRGLGTYSVRLFTEHYLGGRVTFTTMPVGTTFFVDLPLSRP